MKLSLAGWSLQKLVRSPEKRLDLLDLPKYVKERFALDAVELNSPFFASRDMKYLRDLAANATRASVKLLNIAVDEKGDLASEDEKTRAEGLKAYGS